MASPSSSSHYHQRAILCAAAAGAAAGALGLVLWRSQKRAHVSEARDAQPSPASETPQPQPQQQQPLLHPAFAPIDSVEQLLREFGGDGDGGGGSGSAPSPPPPLVPLPPGAPRTADQLVLQRPSGPPPLLICHDMMGGYLPYETATRGVALPLCGSSTPPHPPPAPPASPDPRSLAFTLPTDALACADLFVYFSHHLVTVPPRSWINAAHRHGLPVLGVLIVEGWDGRSSAAADAVLGTADGDDDDEGEDKSGSGLLFGGAGAIVGGLMRAGRAALRQRWGGAGRAAAEAGAAAPPPEDDAAAPPSLLPPARERPTAVARALARLARARGFDGWLLNVEVPLTRGQARRALELTRLLRSELEATAAEGAGGNNNTTTTTGGSGGAFVVWYDAACFPDGRLEWQNALTSRNAPFLDAAGLLFTNYKWGRRAPARSAALARARGAAPFSSSPPPSSAALAASANPRRVLMGVDVYGRGAYGGGGHATGVAMAAARAAGVGAAIFAPGWTWEHGSHREQVEARGEHTELQRGWWSRVRRAWWGVGGSGGGTGERGGGGSGNGGSGNGGSSNSNNGPASSAGSWERVSRSSSNSSSGGGDGGGLVLLPLPLPACFCKAPRPLAWRLPFATNFNPGAWRRLHLVSSPPSPPPSAAASLLWGGGAAAASAVPPPHPGAAQSWCDLSTQEPLPQGVRAVAAVATDAPVPSPPHHPLVALDFGDGFDSGCCLRLAAPPSPSPPLRLFSLAIDVPAAAAAAGGAREVVVRAALRRPPTDQAQPAALAVVLWGKRQRAAGQDEAGDDNDDEEERVLWTGPAWEATRQWQVREAVARLSGAGAESAAVVVTALGVVVVPAAGKATAAATRRAPQAPSSSPLPPLLLGHLSLRAPRAPVPPPAVCC